MRNTACSPHCGIPSLRTTRPADLYHKVIDSLDMGTAVTCCSWPCDSYDVPIGARMIPCKREFRMRCSPTSSVVCPIKEGKVELGYFPVTMNSLRCRANSRFSRAGFLFPAFDDRAANIYNALFTAGRPMKFTRSSLTRSSMWKR